MDVPRARTFGAVAAAYAQHRPGYPAAGVEWALGGRAPVDVLDLGAGTGALTVQLAARPATTVTAVEPDPAMLAELRCRVPAVDARAGSAEAIPLPAAAVDAVLVGQALHWFDLDRALPEIVRVLRPGGVLAGLWNADDDAVEWVAGYHAAATRDRPVPGVPPGRDRPGLPDWPGLHDAQRAEFRHTRRLTVEGLVAVLGTHSWALVSEPADREATFDRIRAYLSTRPETRAEFDLPLVTTVLRATRA
ncbi:MAG: class I SAM-dependent methyltransferase [Pseudonocardia sp.]